MEDADEAVGQGAQGGVVADAAVAQFVVKGSCTGVVHDGGTGLQVQGIDEAAVAVPVTGGHRTLNLLIQFLGLDKTSASSAAI